MGYFSPQKVYGYFDNTFSLTKSTKGWYIFKCPFCNELENRKKMCIHPKYGSAKCWVCGYKESVAQFVMDYEDVTFRQAASILQEQESKKVTFEIEEAESYVISDVKLPIGFTPLLMGDGTLGKRARDYLSGRGFDIGKLDRKGYGYCNKGAKENSDNYLGYIIIPFYQYGKLVYFIGRDYIGNFLRYKNPAQEAFGIGKAEMWYNQDAFYIYDEVYCLEGALDAETLGDDAASSQGWSWSDEQFRIVLTSPCNEVTLVPDAGKDSTGEYFYNKALDVAMKLVDHKTIRVLNLNVFGEKADANSVGRASIMRLRDEAEEEDFFSLIDKRIA